MKNVYILTFAGSVNYGAAFQGYALYKTVVDLGYPCKIIDYNRRTHHKNYVMPAFRQSSFKGKILKLLTSQDRRILSEKFNTFALKHENLTKPYDGEQSLIQETWDQGDIYLLGSDQVLNLAVTEGDFHYYFDFVDSPNKIAYAPSFGTNQIPNEFKTKAEELLRQFRCLTVREESGAKLIAEATGETPEVVLDPSFLLSAERWKDIFKKPREREYVLLFPFRQNSGCIAAARAYAEKVGLPLINIAYMVGHVDGAINIKNLSPEEWGGYVANANKVFTDSFHGMVFSLIFRRDFYVELDKESHNVTRNSRVLDLLNRIGANSILENKDPDYQEIDIALSREIEKSKKMLTDMLVAVSSEE